MLDAWPVSSASLRRDTGCQTSVERSRPPEMASENTELYATCPGASSEHEQRINDGPGGSHHTVGGHHGGEVLQVQQQCMTTGFFEEASAVQQPHLRVAFGARERERACSRAAVVACLLEGHRLSGRGGAHGMNGPGVEAAVVHQLAAVQVGHAHAAVFRGREQADALDWQHLRIKEAEQPDHTVCECWARLSMRQAFQTDCTAGLLLITPARARNSAA